MHLLDLQQTLSAQLTDYDFKKQKVLPIVRKVWRLREPATWGSIASGCVASTHPASCEDNPPQNSQIPDIFHPCPPVQAIQDQTMTSTFFSRRVIKGTISRRVIKYTNHIRNIWLFLSHLPNDACTVESVCSLRALRHCGCFTKGIWFLIYFVFLRRDR